MKGGTETQAANLVVSDRKLTPDDDVWVAPGTFPGAKRLLVNGKVFGCYETDTATNGALHATQLQQEKMDAKAGDEVAVVPWVPPKSRHFALSSVVVEVVPIDVASVTVSSLVTVNLRRILNAFHSTCVGRVVHLNEKLYLGRVTSTPVCLVIKALGRPSTPRDKSLRDMGLVTAKTQVQRVLYSADATFSFVEIGDYKVTRSDLDERYIDVNFKSTDAPPVRDKFASATLPQAQPVPAGGGGESGPAVATRLEHPSLNGEALAAAKAATLAAGFDFAKHGVGGITACTRDLIRRSLTSRLLPDAVVQKLGLRHVKGILLYGPPGCGKTLVAKQLVGMLHARATFVNGPEILNEYVGNSEKNLRRVFEPALADFKAFGAASQLHVVVFDEFDSIAGKRTGSSSRTFDNLVNQLLTIMDGLTEPGNVLVLATTNRKDLIDSALLRPGRFELLVELSAPDAAGRREIWQIHTEHLRRSRALAGDVDIAALCDRTRGLTGAEIASVARSAVACAVDRVVTETPAADLGRRLAQQDIVVGGVDFEAGLAHFPPQPSPAAPPLPSPAATTTSLPNLPAGLRGRRARSQSRAAKPPLPAPPDRYRWAMPRPRLRRLGRGLVPVWTPK
ncbi:Vesicle-fusing ATPase [Diplonema papillatum]|nr:Vesicle-fusing ATPase [Diplonema papillatum]